MSNNTKGKVAILGAGPAGLGAAYYLFKKGYQVCIIDRAHYVGGASASFKIKDYIVDYGPHAFHVKSKDIVDMVIGLIGDDYNKVKRKSRLILDGKNLQYPMDIKEALFKVNPFLSARIIFDYAKANLKKVFNGDGQCRTFQDWGQLEFGDTLYRLAFGNYSEKMWGVSGTQLSYKLAQQKLLKLDLLKIVMKILGFADATFEGGVTTYYDLYPRFGMGTLFDKMLSEILREGGNSIYLDSKITSIQCAKTKKLENLVFTHKGKKNTVAFDYLISTIPLHYLGEYLDTPQRDELMRITKEFKYRDIRVSYVVLDKDYFSDIHWIYLLDEHFKFNRVSEQKNLNKESSPPGKTVISLDISCNAGDSLWGMNEDEFFKLALADLEYFGIRRNHVIDYFSLKLQDVYPVYDLDFDSKLQATLKIIEEHANIYSIGRQGLFLNNDINDSIEMGRFCCDFIVENKDSKQWYDFIKKYIHRSLEGVEDKK